MGKIELIVNSLEEKVQKVLQELSELKDNNNTLKQKMLDLNIENSKLLHSLQEKVSDYDTLKFANSILGSDESKREAKLKINTLIREIDHCISQLSE